MDERLYSVSVYGSGYEPGNFEQLREVGRALARYHGIVASFRPSTTPSSGPPLNEDLRERLARVPSPERVARFLSDHGDDPRVADLLALLPETAAAAAGAPCSRATAS